jgi:hypothetical protein
MRFSLATLLGCTLLLPGTAMAGGLGVLGLGGLHSDRLYYYAADESGVLTQQTPYNQLNPNFGGGLELVLGDKDDKILGVFRAYYMQDAAQTVSGPLAEGGDYVYNIRTVPRDIGMLSGGIQWGIVGDPTGLQFVLTTNIGSGFFTSDFTEFIQAEGGAGMSYMFNRKVQIHAEVTGGVRYRKRIYHTENLYLGVRYLFD